MLLDTAFVSHYVGKILQKAGTIEFVRSKLVTIVEGAEEGPAVVMKHNEL